MENSNYVFHRGASALSWLWNSRVFIWFSSVSGLVCSVCVCAAGSGPSLIWCLLSLTHRFHSPVKHVNHFRLKLNHLASFDPKAGIVEMRMIKFAPCVSSSTSRLKSVHQKSRVHHTRVRRTGGGRRLGTSQYFSQFTADGLECTSGVFYAWPWRTHRRI